MLRSASLHRLRHSASASSPACLSSSSSFTSPSFHPHLHAHSLASIHRAESAFLSHYPLQHPSSCAFSTQNNTTFTPPPPTQQLTTKQQYAVIAAHKKKMQEAKAKTSATTHTKASEPERIERAKAAYNEMLNRINPSSSTSAEVAATDSSTTSKKIHPQQLTNLITLIWKRPALWYSLNLPKTLLQPCQERNLLVSPFTPLQLIEIFEILEAVRDLDTMRWLYTHHVRSQLHITDTQELTAQVAPRGTGGWVKAASQSKQSSSPTSPTPTTAAQPSPEFLTIITHAMRAFVRLDKRNHALVLYDDLWKVIETHQGIYSIEALPLPSPHQKSIRGVEPFRFEQLPVNDLILQLSIHDHHQKMIHLFTVVKFEWYHRVLKWHQRMIEYEQEVEEIKIRHAARSDSSDLRIPSPPVAPAFPSTTDASYTRLLSAIFTCTAQNRRRLLEYFVTVTTEWNQLLEEKLRMKENVKDATPSTPSTTQPSVSLIVDSLSSSIDITEFTNRRPATIDAPRAHTNDAVNLTPNMHSVLAAMSNLNLLRRYPKIEEVAKPALMRLATQFLMADWIRTMRSHTLQSVQPENLMPSGLKTLKLMTQSGRALSDLITPLQFSPSLMSYMTRQQFHQLMVGFLHLGQSGVRLLPKFIRALYNRSIHEQAEAMEETVGERKEIEAEESETTEKEEAKDESAASDRIPATTSTKLAFNQQSWSILFTFYQRFTLNYSHSYAALLLSTQMDEAGVSPYILLKHLLHSKYVHRYMEVTKAVPETALSKLDANQIKELCRLSLFDWHSFWRHIEMIRAELYNEVATIGSNSVLGEIPKHALAIYTKLEEEYAQAMAQQAKESGLIQMLGPVSSSPSTGSLMLIHIPSTLFPWSEMSSASATQELHDYLRATMRCVQQIVLERRSKSKDKADEPVDIGFVLSRNNPPPTTPLQSSAATKSSTAAAASTSIALYPAATGASASWYKCMEENLLFALSSQFHFVAQSVAKVPLDDALYHRVRAPNYHATSHFVCLRVDQARVMNWFTNGCLSFHIDEHHLLPPNSSAAESRVWKQSNTLTDTISAASPIPDVTSSSSASSSRVKSPQEYPAYQTQSYYLRKNSNFIITGQQRAPHFDVNLDLQQQEKEWKDILRIMKNGGEDMEVVTEAQ